MANTFAQQLAGYNPTVAEEKASNLQEAKYNKLNRLNPARANELSGADLQQKLSDAMDQQIYTRDDGSKYQIDYNIDPSTGLSQGQTEVDYTAVNQYGTADTRNLYVDNTNEGNYKLGLARSDKGFQGRYTPDGTYGWAPGERGVTPEDGALLDVELPYDVASQLEYDVHSNKGQILNRATGVTSDEVLSNSVGFGSGKSEYSTPDAPLWNINTQVPEGQLPEDAYMPKVFESKADKVKRLEDQQRKVQGENQGWLEGTVKSLGSSFTKELAVDLADFVGEATTLYDLGTEDEKSRMVNDWFDYVPSTSEETHKKVAVLNNIIWDKDAGLDDKALALVEGVYEAAKDGEMLGTSLGVVAAWVMPGMVLTKGDKAVKLYKSVDALVDAGKLTAKAGAKKKLAILGSKDGIKTLAKSQVGQVTGALGNVNDQYETWVENNNGVPLEGADKAVWMGKAFGVQMFNQNLDAITAVSIVKSPGLIDAARGAMGNLSDRAFGSFVGNVGKAVGSTVFTQMPKEAAQEYTQKMMELTNERYGSEKFKDLDSFAKFLTDEGNMKEGTLDSIMGAGGAAQFQAVGSLPKVPEVLGEGLRKTIEKGTKARQEKANTDAVQSREETITAQEFTYGESVEAVESEAETVNVDGVEVTRFEKPQNIRAQSKDAKEYSDNLEKAKQDVVNSTFIVQDGNIVGLREEVQDMNPDELQDQVNKVNRWMGDYKAEFTDKDGNVNKDVESAYDAIVNEGKLKVGDYIDVLKEDEVLTDEQKTKAASDAGIANIDSVVKNTFNEEQYQAVKESTPKQREKIITDTLKSTFEVTKDVDGKSSTTYEINNQEVPVEYIRRLARNTAKSYEISGINFENVGVEHTPEMLERVGEKEAGLKAKTSEKSEQGKRPVVDFLTMTGDVLKSIYKDSLTKDKVEGLLLDENNSKLRTRVLEVLDTENKAFQNNRSTVLKEVGTKIENAIKSFGTDTKGVFNKGADLEGNLTRLATIAINTINAATASDTEQRQTVYSDNKLVNEGLSKDQYYAGQSNVITQIGKDYLNSFGIQLTGDKGTILKEHRRIGKLALDLLSQDGVDLIETSKNPIWSKVGDNTFTAGNKKYNSSKDAATFKRQMVKEELSDKDTVVFSDTGIRLTDTNEMVIEGFESAGEQSYHSNTGDAIKRLSKLLLPASELIPSTERPTGAIKVDPQVKLYDGEEGSIEGTIRAIQDQALMIGGDFLPLLDEIKELRDSKYNGSINQLVNKVEWVREALGLEKTGAEYLRNHEVGTNNAKLDAISGILDNLDDLDGELYFNYQVDLNNRITLMNTVLNFQHDKNYARQMMTKPELHVTSTAVGKEFLLNDIIENLGLKFDSKEEYADARAQLLDPEKATGQIELLQGIAGTLLAGGKNVNQRVHTQLKKAGFKGNLFKGIRLLAAINDVIDAEGGDITTGYMVEMDASASGVYNTMLNIAGRDPKLFKELLAKLGVEFDGKPVPAEVLEDAYKMLQNQVTEVLNDPINSRKKKGGTITTAEGTASTLIKSLDALGIDTRELAKPPVMTWFYSAGEETITKELSGSLMQQIITMGTKGDKKALAHIASILGRDEVTSEYVKGIGQRSTDAKKMRAQYDTIGELYNQEISDAFPKVTEYKEEMSFLFNELIANSTVGGIDYWDGRVRSASQALYEEDRTMGNEGFTKSGQPKHSNGTTSIHKRKDVALTKEELSAANLTDDERDNTLLTSTQRMSNVSSIMALLAQNVDFAQLEVGMRELLLKSGLSDNLGTMTVHDAFYTSPEHAGIIKKAFESGTMELAVKADFVDTMLLAMEYTAKNLSKVTGEHSVEAKANANAISKVVNKYKAINDARITAKDELLSGAKSNTLGIQDAEKVTGEVETVVTEEVKTEKKPKKEKVDDLVEVHWSNGTSSSTLVRKINIKDGVGGSITSVDLTLENGHTGKQYFIRGYVRNGSVSWKIGQNPVDVIAPIIEARILSIGGQQSTTKEKTVFDRFVETKNVQAFLSELISTNDILGKRAESIQADAVPIIVFDEKAKKDLFKEIDGIPESELSKDEKDKVKGDLQGKLNNGSSFSVLGKAYVGSSTAVGTNEFTGDDNGTIESVLETIGHEVEHAVTSDYLQEQESLGKNGSKEYRALVKAVKKLKGIKKGYLDLAIGSHRRINYILEQKDDLNSVKELVAIYQAEESVRAQVLGDMAVLLGTNKSFLTKAIEGILKTVRGIISGKTYDEIVEEISLSEVNVQNIVLAAEAVSMRSRELNREPANRKAIDDLNIDSLFNKYMKDCKI